MKKLLLVMLLVLCLMPLHALCEESTAEEPTPSAPPTEETIHLLWDIPFEEELDAVKAILLDTKGIRTRRISSNDGNDYLESITGLDEYKLFDRPIALRVYKGQGSAVNSTQIMFSSAFASTEVKEVTDEAALTEKIAPVFKEYLELRDQMRSVYGKPTGGRIRVVQGNMLFNYPMDRNGGPEIERFLAAAKSFPDVYLETDFGNVSLWLKVAYSAESTSFFYNVSLQYSMPNENNDRFTDYELGDFPLETVQVELSL